VLDRNSISVYFEDTSVVHPLHFGAGPHWAWRADYETRRQKPRRNDYKATLVSWTACSRVS